MNFDDAVKAMLAEPDGIDVLYLAIPVTEHATEDALADVAADAARRAFRDRNAPEEALS